MCSPHEINALISKIDYANYQRDISNQNTTTWVTNPNKIDNEIKSRVRKFSNTEEEVQALNLRSKEELRITNAATFLIIKYYCVENRIINIAQFGPSNRTYFLWPCVNENSACQNSFKILKIATLFVKSCVIAIKIWCSKEKRLHIEVLLCT